MSSTVQIYSAVSSHYSAASAGRTKSGSYESTVAKAFGYSEDELSSIPQESNLGLSCGNPLALAALRPGETVLDLGSGAGFDVFLASPKVGSTGQSIGVDINQDMLAKAERNKEKGGYTNVRFVEAPITDIKPIGSDSVDCVISNCVVNLVPEEEKHLVFNEMHRILKRGGRVAISDILIKEGKELPDTLKQDMALYVGCIAGASLIGGYEKYLKDAGFSEILIVDNKKDLNVYNTDVVGGEESKSCCGTVMPVQQPTKSCCGTTTSSNGPSDKDMQTNTASNPSTAKVNLKDIDFNAYAGSYNVYAVKA